MQLTVKARIDVEEIMKLSQEVLIKLLEQPLKLQIIIVDLEGEVCTTADSLEEAMEYLRLRCNRTP